MIKITVLTLTLAISNMVFSKIPTQGVALYKQTINIHASLPKSQAALKAMIPEFQYMDSKTSFNNNIMRFEVSPQLDESVGEPKIGGVRMMSSGQDNIIFDANKKVVSQFGNVMDIDYIFVQEVGNDSGLKFIDETKTINNYSCKKAIDKKNNLVIWYQENKAIIVPSKSFANIPGIVVKVEGNVSYDLISIKESTIEPGYFDMPKNHKKINQEQFQDLQEEAIEEMMSSMGGNAKMFKTEVK